MKLFSILILFLTFVPFVSAQDEELPVYQIKQIHQNADLNEKAIGRFVKNIELRSETDEIMKLFKPVRGKYKVIVFMATTYDLSIVSNKKEIYHFFLILKIDKNNEILDGMEYVLEWTEPPFTARFVRAMKKGVKLKKGLRISELDFRTFETDFQEKFNFWNIDGVIDNIYNFQEIF